MWCGFTDDNLNHTMIYLYSNGKMMIRLSFDYTTDEKCTTSGQYLKYHWIFQGITTRKLVEKVGIVLVTLVLYENDWHFIKHGTALALANALGIDRDRHLDKHTDLVNDLYFSFRLVLASSVSLVSTQASSFTSLLILFPPSLCLCGSPVRFGICKSRCIFEQERTTVEKYRSLPSSAGKWSRVSSAWMSLADIQSFWQTMAYSFMWLW